MGNLPMPAALYRERRDSDHVYRSAGSVIDHHREAQLENRRQHPVLSDSRMGSGNIFGTWTFAQDQYFNPSDPTFSFADLKGAAQFQASFPNLQREMRNHAYAVYVT